MKSDYKIFRVFCVFAVIVLLALLLTTGILTAKYQTEQMVFGSRHSVIQVYEKENTALLNIDGRITELSRSAVREALDFLSYTLFAPVNNLIESGRAIYNLVR